MSLDADLNKLYEEMFQCHILPLWTSEATLLPIEPQPRAIPWMWKWAQLRDLASRAGQLVPVERGGDRRALGLMNPGLKGQPFCSPTLWAAVQWLNAGEVEPAHRHAAQAIRFMVEGQGAYSTVEGDKIFLERGDFAINPPWHWHDHGSEGTGSAIWMDGLDIPLTNYLDAQFFEASEKDSQDVTAVINESLLKYGSGSLRPAWEKPVQQYSPLSTYKWAATEQALMNLAKVDASLYDDVALEYTNPHTGRPVMDTITAWIQMLKPGTHTKAHRHVSSSVYHVFEGQGSTIINGIQFDWERGDIFVIPSWAYHEHINGSQSDQAILFSIHDIPVLKALGKFREQPLATNGGRQVVTGSFDAKLLASI